MGGALIALAQEEVAEVVAQLTGGDAEVAYIGDEFYLAQQIVDVVKANPGLMEKAAARNPKPEAAPASETDTVEAAAQAEEITTLRADNERLSKALADAAPAVEELVQKFTGTIDTLKGEVAELRKRFDDEPLPPKTAGPAALAAVNKGNDSAGGGGAAAGSRRPNDRRPVSEGVGFAFRTGARPDYAESSAFPAAAGSGPPRRANRQLAAN
jgi:hypothetical protein